MVRVRALAAGAALVSAAVLARAEEPTLEQKKTYLQGALTRMLPGDGASIDCLVAPGPSRAQLVEDMNALAGQAAPVFKESELFGKNVNFTSLMKGLEVAKGAEATDAEKVALTLAMKPKLVRLDSDMDCLVDEGSREKFAAQMKNWAQTDVVPADMFSRHPSLETFIDDTIATMDAGKEEKVLAPAAQEPSEEEKRKYLDTMLRAQLPTDDASVGCLVPAGKRKQFMEDLNAMVDETPPVFKEEEIFDPLHKVTFEGLLKGVMIAKGQRTSDVEEYKQNKALLAHELMPKIVASDSAMSCLVGPSMREKFGEDMKHWAGGQDIIPGDLFTKTPAVTLDDFVRDVVAAMGPTANEAAERAAAAPAAPAYSAAAAAAESSTPATTTTGSPETQGWKWYHYVLIAMFVCCVCPCIGLACSAAMCYESVAWIFGGDDKPQKRKSRGVKVKQQQLQEPRQSEVAALAAPPAAASAVAPTGVQYLPVATSMVYPAPVTYTAPVPVQYAQAPVVQYQQGGLVRY